MPKIFLIRQGLEQQHELLTGQTKNQNLITPSSLDLDIVSEEETKKMHIECFLFHQGNKGKT